MKENLEDYRKDGFINLDEYFLNNPSGFTYPYYIDGYDKRNFWAKVRKEDEDKYIYIKPRDNEDNSYNVYAELIYEELLNQVGIKTASFDVAKYEGNSTTISDNILYNYSNNEFIINGSELLDSRRYSDEEYSIEDLFNTIHEYSMVEYIDKDMEKKCIDDIHRVCIADIFTLSTDRRPTDFDFIVGRDENDEEVIKLAPVCHNTYALGSNFTIDEMYDMLDDEDMLADRVELCYSDAGVPDYKRNYDYPYWEDSLYYLINENDENLNFAIKCAKYMDIYEAIKKVEEKINSNIPIEYKEFVYDIWNNRLQNICECIDIDLNKIKDEKVIYKEEK